MTFTIVTLFPDMFTSPFGYSILKRARQDNTIQIHFVNIRDYAEDTYKTVDDHPYGGGAGMILKVDIVDKALMAARTKRPVSIDKEKERVILLDPRGQTFTQNTAKTFASSYEHIILVCGHYEGVDERIRLLVDETVSIGDYVVTGGELPAMILVDSITRLLSGVIHPMGPKEESFENGLEYPQYTRPKEYKGMSVPDVLLSGNHADITAWKHMKAQEITQLHRPDLDKTLKD